MRPTSVREPIANLARWKMLKNCLLHSQLIDHLDENVLTNPGSKHYLVEVGIENRLRYRNFGHSGE